MFWRWISNNFTTKTYSRIYLIFHLLYLHRSPSCHHSRDNCNGFLLVSLPLLWPLQAISSEGQAWSSKNLNFMKSPTVEKLPMASDWCTMKTHTPSEVSKGTKLPQLILLVPAQASDLIPGHSCHSDASFPSEASSTPSARSSIMALPATLPVLISS